MIKVSTDKSKIEVDRVHSFLSKSYWAEDRTLHDVLKTIEHSFCFGVYSNDLQVGFARVVTDFTVFAYIMDLFIFPEFQGKGYSKILVESILDNDKLKNCKTWVLKTQDAHGLYEKFGFKRIKSSEKWMELKF